MARLRRVIASTTAPKVAGALASNSMNSLIFRERESKLEPQPFLESLPVYRYTRSP
jgi:hypothetical protein